jgi:uncharacterized protein YjbJ (UPF0337 family)
MNQDHVQGSLRSAMGQGEKVAGQAMNDPRTTAEGIYDEAAGKARSALGSAGDAVSRSADAVSALDFSALRDEVSKLTQMVADLAQDGFLRGAVRWSAQLEPRATACLSLQRLRRTSSPLSRATSKLESRKIRGGQLQSRP